MATDSRQRVVLSHRTCPACGADAPNVEVTSTPPGETLPFAELRRHWSGLFGERVFATYARCGRCALLYAPEFMTLDQLSELYADMAPNMELLPRRAIEATQRGYWEAAKSAGSLDGDYLEVGPDTGHVVAHAVAEGRFDRLWLFEPNRAVHEVLATATADCPHVISTEMDDWSEVPDASVGLAVMIHVLDHLLDPLTVLTRARDKLKPGGRLLIVTHNEGSLLRRVMGDRWPPFCLQHPQLYNPASMTKLVSSAGFSSVRISRSRNYFPLSFMARQAINAFGIPAKKLPLPNWSLGLKLGNMLTVATP